jgi:hypothetical protein
MSDMTIRRIYCKYCGRKLKYDDVGPLCGTRNCQWEFGVDNETKKQYEKERRKRNKR